MRPQFLECQDCGTRLHELTPEQAQRVADNPMNYILLCRPCAADHEREMWRVLE